MSPSRRLVALVAALVVAGAAGVLSGQAESPPHHTGDGFRNNYERGPRPSFWAWKWEQIRDGLPASPPEGGWKIPWVRTDAAVLKANTGAPTLTWIGHASFLVQLAGRNLLFDPNFSERASPVSFAGPKRIVPLPIDVPELPRIDVVFVSHNHYDHLDLDTVRRLAAQPGGSPLFLVPLELKAWFEKQGIRRVVELDWWQAQEAAGLRATLVPVQHWSKRTLFDANETLWGGWVVEGGGLKIIHTGDLGYSKDARDVGERLGPFDLALIPIGAYAPRWFMGTMHVDVPQAVQVREDLRAARAIGMHWGTFDHLTDEPMDEPPKWLASYRELKGLGPDQFDVMKIGETREIVAGR
jgi:L-ascorbate metabolism protein UlaG (beta-lactamase superfamily)